MSSCCDLIGKRYQYGTNAETVDCISLVIQALDRMGIDNPGLKIDWYGMSPFAICRELRFYTNPIKEPSYDGDIVLLSGDPIAFGIQWQGGILYINREAMKVDWKPASVLSIVRSYRMNAM